MAEKNSGAVGNTETNPPNSPQSSSPSTGQPDKLFSLAYLSLLATQFFGAANDNILKQVLTFMVATGIWSGSLGWDGLGEGGQVVPALCLTLPFIFLSGYAGQISDKFSKQTVMFWVKVAEIPIALIGFAGFFTHNLWLTVGAMLMLAVQSSFYGPAKYGVLPEIVHDQHLSMANGVINMLTNLAVIAGSLIAGPLSDLFHPQPPPIPPVYLELSEPVDDVSKLSEPFEFLIVEELAQKAAKAYVIATDAETTVTGTFIEAATQEETDEIPELAVLSSASIDTNGDGDSETIRLGERTQIKTASDQLLGEITVGQDCSYEFSPAADYFANVRTPVPWAPGVGLVVVALLGFFSVSAFPRMPAANPNLKFDLNPFTTYFESLRFMSKGPLLAVVIAWAAFYMIAMIALLILPEYQSILRITFTKTSYLLGVLGIGIGIGSLVTGFLSGKEIKPWLIPFGAGGMCVCFLLLGVLKPTYVSVLLLVTASGFFAGFYIVPLQALIQILSPDEERGRIIGTSGAISFCFSSLGPVVFWVASSPMGMQANRIFLICAAMAIVGTIYGVIQLKKIMDFREQQQLEAGAN